MGSLRALKVFVAVVNLRETGKTRGFSKRWIDSKMWIGDLLRSAAAATRLIVVVSLIKVVGGTIAKRCLFCISFA